MSKKLLIGIVTLLLSLAISITCCYASDNMAQDAVDGVRGAVQGTENAVEDAAKGISNASKEATGDMEKGANAVVNNVSNAVNTATTSNNMTYDNNDYTATRTSSDGVATYMGMTATMWTWLIMAISAAIIVALVWFYANQKREID